MTKIKNVILTICTLTILYSCGDGHRDQNKISKNTIQDDRIEIRGYGLSRDLVEELYKELVSKNPELKKLEKDIENYESKHKSVNKIFQNYNSKSEDYYNSANSKSILISDSLLRNKISMLISKSKDNYSNKSSDIHSLLYQISENNTSIKDHHVALKIMLTLPIIEKYQDDNRPEKKEFKELTKQQQNLLEQVESVTPK